MDKTLESILDELSLCKTRNHILELENERLKNNLFERTVKNEDEQDNDKESVWD